MFRDPFLNAFLVLADLFEQFGGLGGCGDLRVVVVNDISFAAAGLKKIRQAVTRGTSHKPRRFESGLMVSGQGSRNPVAGTSERHF